MTRKKGEHLSLLEREKIMLGLGMGKSYRQLDKELGLSNGIVGNEVRTNRNQITGEYLPIKAHRKALKREKGQRQKAPLKSPEIYLYVKEKLREYWSPEQIAGRIKIDLPGCSIDDETIYRFIYDLRKHPHQDLRIYLTHHQKKRRKQKGRKVKKSIILERKFINERSPTVILRSDFGHFETDLMEGLRKDKSVVSVTTERKTRFTKLSLLPNKTSKEKANSIYQQLQNFPVLSITTDNGVENIKHQQWTSSLPTHPQIYFTNPYHSWEKGTVENTIGRLRFFLPKKTSISSLTSQQLQLIETYLNSTPRKCLNFLTPTEALNLELKKLKYT